MTLPVRRLTLHCGGLREGRLAGQGDEVTQRPTFRAHFPILHPWDSLEAESVRCAGELIMMIPWGLIEQQWRRARKLGVYYTTSEHLPLIGPDVAAPPSGCGPPTP